MSKLSLAQLEDKTSAKFEPVDIILEEDGAGNPTRVLKLQHVMRLPKAVRKEIARVQNEKNAAEDAHKAAAARVQARDAAVEAGDKDVPALLPGDEDEVDFEVENLEYFRALIRLVSDDKESCEFFLEHVGDDLAFLAVVFAEWSEKISLGEASSSES